MSTNTSVLIDFIYSIPPSGLSIWLGFAKSIRVASRGNNKYLPMQSGHLIPSTPVLTNYYMGSAIIITIIALVFLLTVIVGFCQCCALCCCKASLARKRQERVSTRRSVCWSWFWFGLINILFLISAIASFTGSSFLSTSVDQASIGTLGTISSSQAIVLGLSSSVGNAFSSLQGIVNHTADAALNIVDYNSLQTTGVTPNLNALANGIQTTQDNITAMLTQGNSISASKSNTQALADQVNVAVSADNTAAVDWKNNAQSYSGSGGATYVYTGTDLDPNAFNAASNAAMAMASGISQTPDGASSLAPLQNLGLTAYATQIRDVVTSLPININTLMLNGTGSFKISAIGALNSAQSNITETLAPFQTSAQSSLTSIYSQISSLFTQVKTYNNYRHIAMSILSAILLVIVVVINAGAACRRPRIVKGCSFTAIGFYALIQLLALILYTVAMLVGDACSLTFEYSPPPIAVGLDISTQISVNNLFQLRDQCGNNQSLLTIAANLGYLNAGSINMTRIASDQLNSLDFTPIANSWNITSSISVNPSPTAKLSALTSLDTSSLNVTALNNITTTALPALRTALTNLRNVYNIAIGTTNGSTGLTFTLNGQPNSVTAAGYTDFLGKLTTRRDALNAFLASGGQLDQMQTSVDSMISSVQSLNTSTTNAISAAGTIPGYYSSSMTSLQYFAGNATLNLTTAIPQLKLDTTSSVGGVQDRLYASLRCQDLAANIYTIQDSLCGRFMGGLDSVWFSYYVIGIFSFISIPAFIYFANVMGATRRHTGSVDVEAGYGRQAPNHKKKRHAPQYPEISRSVSIS
ncbi:hypothetical protein BASA50_007223 [Batrachochytrium salamandrivorans]|uniref:Prominin n=1 Tax=Batrachochytrium salamandrivorans TaxID=1357716 RepID=A0ABQ8F7Q0_9FUNG|nr:hypothetical protein BASA62_000027 [Batrachochytrium salamandrivorans]KAH6593665.1 hypothetical protein BASA50_007223 [Batrachochytrium salamandrivorans]KAH9248206.1 hypothetical protein BASA81_014166 [Batrachochytrium salamandrivorans]KAJ1328500.1 hypothetical protein BSLG_010232 [Batrachochytrium salamandrivorans]